jgi:hypothetical protein
MSATIGRDHVVDLVVGNRRPYTVHFNFVVVANDATLGRSTIHQIAARALAIVSFECRVEALMPFIMAHPLVPFLRCCACRKTTDTALPSVMNTRRFTPSTSISNETVNSCTTLAKSESPRLLCSLFLRFQDSILWDCDHPVLRPL